MITYVIRIILMLTIVTGVMCQYGIPDDDDDVPVRVSPVQLTTAAPPPTPRTPEVKMTYYEEEVKSTPPVHSRFAVIRNQPQYSSTPVRIAPSPTPVPVRIAPSPTPVPVRIAPSPTPVPVRIAPSPTPVPLPVRVQSVQYSAPVVRTATPITAAPKVEKIQIRDTLPAYTASTPATPSVVKQSYSAPQTYTSSEVRKKPVPIVKYLMEDDNYGTFKLETVSGDGSVNTKSGYLKDLGDKEGPVQVMHGTFGFTGDDGKAYSVTWTADEKGFRATGDHLPTPPPAQH